jgi:hypothetical protein
MSLKPSLKISWSSAINNFIELLAAIYSGISN